MSAIASESPVTVDARETVVAGGLAAAGSLAGMYWLLRTGFDNPAGAVVEALGLVSLILAVPALIHRQLRGPSRWWNGQPAMTIALVVVTALPGALMDESARLVGTAVAVAGFLAGLLVVGRWLAQGSVLSSVAFLAGAAGFGVWGGGVLWSSRYKMPLFWETLSFRSNVHHDPFYMTAIGNMLDVYGVPSTGLDGIPHARYHFGSSWLLTQWAELTGTDSLSFYSLGYAVVAVPLFFAAIFMLALELRTLFFGDLAALHLRSDWKLLAVFAVAVIGFIPNDGMDALAVWNGHALASESYLVGLTFFMLAIAVAAGFWRGAAGQSYGSAWLFFAGFAPAAMIAAGLLKVSLMVLLLGAMLYLVARLHLWRRIPVAAGVVAAIALAGWTYGLAVLPEHNTGISPLNFMRFQVETGWQQFFPLAHLLLTWVYVAGRLWEERIGDWRSLGAAIRERQLLDVEILLVVALAGFVPGEVISIHGGSAVFFSDVQRWLALSFILARAGAWLREHRLRRAPVRTTVQVTAGWRGVRVSWLLALIVAGPFVATVAYNAIQWPVRAVRTNLTLRRELVALAKGDSTAAANPGMSDVLDPALLGAGLRRTAYYPIVTALRGLSDLPSSERRRTLLFIPHSNSAYWRMFTDDGRCVFTPLVAPAVAGIALVDGMPPFGCGVTDQYNMNLYAPRTHAQAAAETTDAAVCGRARARGFGRVIVLEENDQRRPEIRRIDCPGSGLINARRGSS